MMVNSAKDMFSDTETLKDVHFDTMSYLYFEDQGRNANMLMPLTITIVIQNL